MIKTYVRLGLGVGIMASMAYSDQDNDLVAIDASHLSKPVWPADCIQKGSFLRRYTYDFINIFAPHLTRSQVETAEQIRDNDVIRKMFDDVELEYL